MFCDLVGSTALSTRHDPEDLRELIGDYHRAVADTVGRLDGFVAKYMGDGVLIYFGYPQAHEDDAERAVRAGLAVIEAVGKLPGREDLSVRLGIATGLAVVGDLIGEGAAQERGVVGETPNLAARLQALAMPGTLVIAEATRRQVGGLFDLADLGPQALAGFAEPQPAWRVIGESGMLSRFEALRSGETPLVGRDEELDLLLRRWMQAKSGEGRVVLISGEPGIGKSRLTAALSERIETEPHTRLRYFCSPHHQDSALYPFIAQLERAAGFVRDDTVEARLGKLRTVLAPGAPDDDDFALLSELLSLPNNAAALNLSPQRKRENLFEAMLNQLEAEARQRPVLMVFEDAHWIDPTTRELLDLTVDRVRHLPVLLVITFRPEFQPPWGGRSQVASVALNRLGERDGEALVQTLAGNTALAAEIIAEIVERTDGVPLFVEELTKAVLESVEQGDRVAAVLATTSLAALSVPATLHASLMARLDRLGPTAKEIAQIGAVLGREFGYELIEPVAQRSAAELQAALDQLGEAGLLFCRGTPPHSSYLFKHALVQDAAYSTLLRGRRQELHARVADTLERARVIDRAAVRPEILAYHLAQTLSTDRAVAYLREAAQVAAGRWANAEAVQHLSRARELSSRLDDGPAKRKLELAILLELGPMLLRVEGFLSASVEEVYRLAQGLCAEGDNAEQRFAASWGLWFVTQHQHQSRLGHARQLAEELIGLGEASQDPGLLLQAHHSAWTTLFALGDDCTALRHAEEGINLYDIHEHRTHSSRNCTRCERGRIRCSARHGRRALRSGTLRSHP
jgi:class 3 adenylate cyclase